jgi:large subunit ribosomal protein L17
MRHRKSGRKLNRNSAHRKALFRNMARSLLTFERIRTTEAKAKDLRGFVDRLITLALKNDLHARRLAYKELGNHQLVQRLFDEIGPRFAGGAGGYTRIVKLAAPRAGDAAPMVLIELTRLAEKPVEKKAEKKAEEPKPAEAPKAEEAKPARKPARKAVEKAVEKPARKKAAPAEAAEEKPKAKKAKPKAEEAKPAKKTAAKPKAKKAEAEAKPKARKKKEEKTEK